MTSYCPSVHSYTSSVLTPSAPYIHLRHALYWRHMVTFKLIINITQTSLELQAAKAAVLESVLRTHSEHVTLFVWIYV